jgi:serine/threonine protein kinase
VPLEAGQVVAAKLRLVRPLGAGGMGSVWVADHLTLKTQVAVKFMSEALAGNVEALARFSREAAAAARIKSPHVVKVFDFGVWERTTYAYWAEGPALGDCTTPGTVQRLALGAAASPETIADNLHCPAVAFDSSNGYVYWSDGDAIFRLPEP